MIRFGTDGWRAIIAKDFTFDNVNCVTQATAAWIQDDSITTNGVVIGHDARFLGREFSEHCACTFAEMGIPVKDRQYHCSYTRSELGSIGLRCCWDCHHCKP
jgi:phosphomannomutase